MTSILQRLAKGDTSAADECVNVYGGLIWRLTHRYLDHATSEIDDAIQDIFVEIWLHADRFDPAKGSEPAFIATIAHRRLTDRQRRIRVRRRTMQVYTDELNGIANHQPSGYEGYAEDAHSAAHNSGYRELLETGFRDLPEDERNALWLAVYRGLSHREISEATNAPIGTVKSRLRRAMIRLTKLIANKSGTESQQEGGPL